SPDRRARAGDGDRARAHALPRHRRQGLHRERNPLARRPAVGSRGARLRRLDGGDARARRLAAPVFDLVPYVRDGAARGADADRIGRALHGRGLLRRTPRRADDARALPGLFAVTAQDEELFARAEAIAARAYAPYSGFLVGAAALTTDG